MRSVLLLVGFACGAPLEAEDVQRLGPRSVLTPGSWALADEDPFEDRPMYPDCSAAGFHAEGDALEVETGICRYATASQRLSTRVEAGEEISGLIWHLTLTAPTPAEGHVAVVIGRHILVDERIPIPHPEAFHAFTWTAPESLPAGTEAFFHVHNHGANSWRLGPIDVR